MNSVRVLLNYSDEVLLTPLYDLASFCEERFEHGSYCWEGVEDVDDTVEFTFKNVEDAIIFKLSVCGAQ